MDEWSSDLTDDIQISHSSSLLDEEYDVSKT